MRGVAELAVDFKLLVARPAPTAGLEKEVELVNSVLDELARPRTSGFNIELVEPGKSADLRLAVLRENAIAGAAAGRQRQAGAVVPAGVRRLQPEGRQQAAADRHPSG